MCEKDLGAKFVKDIHEVKTAVKHVTIEEAEPKTNQTGG
jgi:hypothetical protein